MLTGIANHILCLAFSPDGKYLAASSQYGGIVKVWSVELQRQIFELLGHHHYVYTIAFSPNGKYLASGSEDYTVKLWDMG
jgi:WD40 repeat protein